MAGAPYSSAIAANMLVGAGGDGLVEAAQHDDALGRRGARHRREGALGGGNREFHIIGVAEANLPICLSVAG